MKFINNLSIRNKLILIVSIPLIVLCYLMVIDFSDMIATKGRIEEIYSTVNKAELVSNTIQQIQKERRYAAIYILIRNIEGKSDLNTQREETDKSISALKSYVAENNQDAEQFDFLNSLPNIRYKTDTRQISLDTLISLYGLNVGKLISVVDRGVSLVEEPEIGGNYDAQVFLLKSKNDLGELRSSIAESLVKKDFGKEQLSEFAVLKGEYESYLNEFHNRAPKELVAELDKKITDPSIQRCIELIDTIYRTGVFPSYLTYDEWYDYANSYTTAMFDVLTQFSSYIRNSAENKLAGINEAVIRTGVIIVILIFIIGFMLFYITKAIVASVNQIRESAEKISEGEVNLDLNINSKDEIGVLAETFRKMIKVNNEYAVAAEVIGKGDYTVDVRVRSERDVLGSALNTMKENLGKLSLENETRTWLLSGNGDLNDKIRGEKRIEELASEIVNFLTDYLKAQIGAIYLVEDGKLTLVSTYAFSNRKGNTNVVKMGEGLVGQSALEKKPIIFGDVPDDYIRINSGLGNSLPKNIVVYPFLYENDVIGVIEIGSTKEFSDLDMQFLELVSESIGIAMKASQSRERMKELLEETQRQSEELEAQQEELKQTNEELSEKTQMLEKSEAELKAQQEELQQTNEELEEKAELLESQKERLERAKMEIETKARELEITSKYKSEFLANMSHELRTPMNSILILSQLMADNKSNALPEKEVEFAKNIFNSGNDLLKLINEILDLSKVEAGKIELEISDVEIDAIISSMKSTFNEIAKIKSIDFDINYDPKNFSNKLFTDKQRTEQILKNLLSNAFKFTEKKGSITLNIELAPNDIYYNNLKLNDAKEIIAFSVKDNGIGIPESKQRMVFEAFQQADGSTKRKYGGTGLGLSISKELATVLGGEIHLKSKEGEGSTFTLYLPLKNYSDTLPTEESAELPTVKEEIMTEIISDETLQPEFAVSSIIDDRFTINENDRTIVILEDDESFAKILLDYIRERHFKGIVAHQGNMGLSLIRHYRPDAIILDMKLPVMDGVEILKQLKNDPALRHIPVQIISGYDKRKEGIDLGAFGFLKKPLLKEDLHNAFDRIVEFINKKLKKLLIVEDNKVQNKAIKELIGNGDVKTYPAFTGEDAFKMLKDDKFDCIIIDLGLPDMSGFELMEKIKGDTRLNATPIVVYTGKDLNKEETTRLNKLASAVVLKTAESHERLLDETTLFLHRIESRLPEEKRNIIRKLHHTDEVLKNKKVLIVDDDMRNIYSITNVLEEEGMTCVTAENGKESLKVLKDNSDIDIVLMDVMMPEMDGYESTLEIRKMNKFGKLPIIALTAKAMKGDREKCLEVGMSDYIAKPVNIDQMLSLMRVWLYK